MARTLQTGGFYFLLTGPYGLLGNQSQEETMGTMNTLLVLVVPGLAGMAMLLAATRLMNRRDARLVARRRVARP